MLWVYLGGLRKNKTKTLDILEIVLTQKYYSKDDWLTGGAAILKVMDLIHSIALEVNKCVMAFG